MSSVVLMSLDTALVGACVYVTGVSQLVTVTGYAAAAVAGADAAGGLDVLGVLGLDAVEHAAREEAAMTASAAAALGAGLRVR
jgi:aminoglycoside/choline kinase family phosphotransferase